MEQGTMSGNEMSTVDILQTTAELVGSILVPVAFANEISRPLSGVLGNINYLIERLKKEEADGNGNVDAK